MRLGRLFFWLRVTGFIGLAGVLLVSQLSNAVGDTSGDPAWSNPGAMTVRLVGPATDIPVQPNFTYNLDCTELTYRLVSSPTMLAGCFTPTAYGYMDPDSGNVIFNGTDEALPINPYSPHQAIIPWPRAANVLTLDAALTGGSYLGMYRDITGHLQDQRDLLARLKSKQVTAPPDLPLLDPAGKPLVINPQSLAFSDQGSWLVAETLSGSFVRINLAGLAMLPFTQSFGSQGSPALLKSQTSISDNGRYVAIENPAAQSFKVYDLKSCARTVADLTPLACPNFDYWPFLHAQISDITSIQHVRFLNAGLLSLNVSTGAGTNNYLLAPAASIHSLIDYLATGDSYTSGEGAFDYTAGTNSGDNGCHLSVHSYPLLLTNDLYNNASGHSVACSGAKIQDIAPDKPAAYRGQARDSVPLAERSSGSLDRVLADYSPGYLGQSSFVKRYQPGVLTVSVGGDDIGFGDIVLECVEPHVSLHLSDEVCYDSYEDRVELKQLIDRTVPRWVALYRQLATASPDSRSYAIGYPQVAADQGDCGLNVHLSRSELEFSAEIIDYLNGAMRQAAALAKVSYIDISQALVGHRLCEASGYAVAVNGLTAGTAAGPLGIKIFGKESYHPNAAGQALIEAAILRQTHNFTQTLAASSGTNDSQTLLNVPRSGRAVTVLTPLNVTSTVVGRGQSNLVQVNGAAVGLVPSRSYVVHIDGSNGPIIGNLATDADNQLSDPVAIPAATDSGSHTIDITGPMQSGDTIDIRQPVYVPVADGDTDGDGLPDPQDSCPGAVNGGVDGDQDGIDDVCDPVIGAAAPAAEPPQTPTATTSSGDLPHNNSPSPTSISSVAVVGSTVSTTGQGQERAITSSRPGTTGKSAGSTAATNRPIQPTASGGHQVRSVTSAAPPPVRHTTGYAIWLGTAVSLTLLLILLLFLLARYLKQRLDDRFRQRVVPAHFAVERGG